MGNMETTDLPCNATVDWDNGHIWTSHTEFVTKDYFLSNITRPYANGSDFCAANGGRVGMIKTAGELKKLRGEAYSSFNFQFWNVKIKWNLDFTHQGDIQLKRWRLNKM